MRFLNCYKCKSEYYAPRGWYKGCPKCELNLDKKQVENLKVKELNP